MSAPYRQPNAKREPLSMLFAAASDGINKSTGAQRNGFSTERLNNEHNQAAQLIRSPANFANPSLSALSIPDGYVITERDRERMLRNLARNAASPTFVAGPSPAPLRPPSYHLPSAHPAKRSLNPPAQQYASNEGPLPKKGFFAPPVVRSQRSASEKVVAPSQKLKHVGNDRDRRLSAEAAKRGVGRLDLSTASFHGIDKAPELGDLPELGQAGTTPGYAKNLQETRKKLGKGGRMRKDSKVGNDKARGLNNAATEQKRKQDILEQALQQHNMQEKFRRMADGAAQKRRAMNGCVTMREVEVNDRTTKLMDKVCSYEGRYGHLHRFEQVFKSQVKGEDKAMPARAPIIDLDDEMFGTQTTLEQGRAESYEVLSSETEESDLGLQQAEISRLCQRDEDGTYRAPEEEGESEERVEVLWSLKLIDGEQKSALANEEWW